jgi:hypothetical protein
MRWEKTTKAGGTATRGENPSMPMRFVGNDDDEKIETII